jgi:hypothetical protein
MFSVLKNTPKHGVKWNVFSAKTENIINFFTREVSSKSKNPDSQKVSELQSTPQGIWRLESQLKEHSRPSTQISQYFFTRSYGDMLTVLQRQYAAVRSNINWGGFPKKIYCIHACRDPVTKGCGPLRRGLQVCCNGKPLWLVTQYIRRVFDWTECKLHVASSWIHLNPKSEDKVYKTD